MPTSIRREAPKLGVSRGYFLAWNSDEGMALQLEDVVSADLLQSQIQKLYDIPAVARVATDDMRGHPAWPEELASLGPAVPRRTEEFLLGRACARAAMAALVGTSQPIFRRGRRPVWPPGVVGSISHCADVCAAVVGTSDRFAAIGLDVERNLPVTPRMLRTICRPAEIQAYQANSTRPILAWGKIAFSAKEAIYKCYEPVFGVFLDFHDIHLTLTETRAATGVMIAELINPAKPGAAFIAAMRGRWRLSSGLVLSGAWHPTLCH
jgi:4'-phosphopantetheinyl transferase EntD